MANLIPLAYADVELQLATVIAVGATSFSLASANDDDGNALPSGKYCFTIDNGSSNKEYLMGQLNGVAVTSVKSLSRQGVETTGSVKQHRVGSSCIITDFATIQRAADILRGVLALDGSAPLLYDAEPTLTDRKQIATLGKVLDLVLGGTVAFDNQIVTGILAGETIASGDSVYLKESDQRWWKSSASTAATVDNVKLGIALSAGTAGVAIASGVLLEGVYTTSGLTAGSRYYISNTAGARSTTPGTTSLNVGIAYSTTKLLFIPRQMSSPTDNEKAALAGNFGALSSLNRFVTETFLNQTTTQQTFNSSGTWTKLTGLKRVRVRLWGAGGSGGCTTDVAGEVGGGGGGGYIEYWFEASALGATEAVTIGVGGAAVSGFATGNAGGNSTFGTLLTAYAGGAGSQSSTGGGGGGGGSLFSIGGNASGSTAGTAGDVLSGAGGVSGVTAGGGANTASAGAGGTGGNAFYGGGGGGGVGTSSAGAGGTSKFGGAGGLGLFAASGNATSGVQPGGGGGAKGSTAGTGNSGAGADGRCIVTEFYA